VRIVGGTHKGRHISPDKKFKARPTTDFAKENIFNVISNWYDIDELDVLDLFSGTGSISYEFASREANSIISIEKDFSHHAFIKKTISSLGFENIKSFRGDVFKYLKTCKTDFDLIFADPPYALEGIEKIPELVFENKLLRDKGILIVEHSKDTDLSGKPYFSELRTYGSVNFSIFFFE